MRLALPEWKLFKNWGKRSQSLWGLNFGYSPNAKVVEGEGGTFEALSTIFRRLDQDL